MHLARHGVDCDHSRQFCTIEKINEARLSHFYATRGYTRSEQEADTRRHSRNPNNRHTIRRQMDELVAAQIARDGDPQPPAERPPAEAQLRLGFEETDPPSDWDIPECYVFKVVLVLAPACLCVGFPLIICHPGVWSLLRSINRILERPLEQQQVGECLLFVHVHLIYDQAKPQRVCGSQHLQS
jgi:hypothetical protein